MPKILIVEDEPKLRFKLRKILEDASFDVKEAENGVDALRKIPMYGPDLLITDIVMPEKEGLELIMEIRVTNKELPIVAFSEETKNNETDFLSLAKAIGATSTEEKPYKKSTVLKAVGESLGVDVMSNDGK